MKKILLLCFSSLWVLTSYSNNIAVANVSLTDQVVGSHYCNVKFDLSWENSWRTSSIPFNWDAAWVFVKYRVSGGNWHHCSLSATTGDHTPATGSMITPSADGRGVFIYRSSNGSGTNTWSNLKLRWMYGNDGITDDASLEIKVFAIEMVYIPQGEFHLGDGNGTSESDFAFHPVSSDNTPFQVTTASNIMRCDVGSPDDDYLMGYGGQDLYVDGDGGIVTTGGSSPQNNPGYPTGYKAFYLMKYETSQEQYVDFINTLTRAQQDQRLAADISGSAPSQVYVMSNTSGPAYRNGVRCPSDILAPGPVTLFCDLDADGTGNETNDGQNVACNYVGYPDLAAYADWSGLRPITELEYEKAARGLNYPVLGEFAWGTAGVFANTYTLSNQGMSNEAITNCGVGTGNALFITGMILSPVRVGIFAASATNKTRVETGAGYYGNMELSGNLYDRAVCIGTVPGRSFTGLHGNGELNFSGDADVDYWPGINGNNDYFTANGPYGGSIGVTGAAGIGERGGECFHNSGFGRISDRQYGSSHFGLRQYYYGFRLGRSAP